MFETKNFAFNFEDQIKILGISIFLIYPKPKIRGRPQIQVHLTSLNLFDIFLMLEDPQKISMSKISNFLEKNLRSGFTGSWQIPKGTKS